MENLSPKIDSFRDYSKYSLVVAVAKRARQIVSHRESGVVFPHKPVTMALDELAQGTIRMIVKPEITQEAPQEESSETPQL